jgi:hypothetical protein
MLSWMQGDLDAAREHAALALETGPSIAAWAECSTSAAVTTGVAVAQGRFDEAEEFGAMAERLMRWAGFPPTAQTLYPSLACARAQRGDFVGAHNALDAWELTPTPGLRRFRSLLHAMAGDFDAVAPHRQRERPAAPGTFMFSALSIAVEIGDLLDDIDRIEWAAPGIEYLASRGVRFDLGWCFFLPRLAGVAALRLGRLDDAQRWLELARSEAVRSGATTELTRVHADLDRLARARVAPTTPT